MNIIYLSQNMQKYRGATYQYDFYSELNIRHPLLQRKINGENKYRIRNI